jgi:rod shape-determining protein MreC
MQKIRDVRRRLVWGASILCIALVSIMAMAPAPEGRGGVVRQEVSRLFRPLYLAITWVESGISSVWHHYIYLTHVSVENAQLRAENVRLHSELQATTEARSENARLQALLTMAAPWNPRPIAARVIASHPHHDLQTITIDRGWADGIERDRPVMAAGGLVGRVRVVTEHTATVLLLTDPNSSVDVMDARSRVRGLLVGVVRATELRRPVSLTQLEYVAHDSDIQEGDDLMTSGMDGVYPKGLPVGRVHELNKDEFGLFEEAWVLPLADMSRLEDVVVL